MRIIVEILPYIQIVLAALLVALVLLQQSDADLGGTFGGGDTLNASSHTRRGIEKTIFNSTILIGILFAVASLLALIIR